MSTSALDECRLPIPDDDDGARLDAAYSAEPTDVPVHHLVEHATVVKFRLFRVQTNKSAKIVKIPICAASQQIGRTPGGAKA